MSIHYSWSTRLIGALIGAMVAIAVAIPAAAGASPATEPTQFSASSAAHPQLASSGTPVLRRDGSKAVPFVADPGPKAPGTDGGFDWGDAAIGAGVVTGVIALGLGAVIGTRRRKASPQPRREPVATSS